MLDGFIAIPGPKFLGYFTLIAFVAVPVGWLWAQTQDDSLQRRLPDLTGFDQYTIAALRGTYQVMHTALFNLWSKDLLVIEEEGDDPVLKKGDLPNSPDSPVESVILKAFKKPSRLSDVLSDSTVKDKVDRKIEPIRTSLQKSRLLRTDEEMGKIRKVAFTVCGILVAIGGLKFVIGISRDKPSVFLLFMVVAYSFVAYWFLKPRPQTRLGKKYLDKLKEHFNWTKDSLKEGIEAKGYDPAWPVAIFGAGFLADIPRYSWFTPASKRSKDNWAGGCGTGCGGCGHSHSSGCSGGCGGGCGGCGGCGS